MPEMSEAEEIRDEEQDAERDAERLARRRIALAQIRQYPDPVLRMRANDVEEFDDDLRQLAERMTALMGEALGVGLAANQVGVLQRMFIFQPTAEDEPRAMVNPEIVSRSEEVVQDDEGCLSMQGVLVPVDRNLQVTIEARDLDGEGVRLELEGMSARVVQHELDHLDGTLIIDRTTPDGRREALAVLRQAV
jgi:peptide deformylase